MPFAAELGLDAATPQEHPRKPGFYFGRRAIGIRRRCRPTAYAEFTPARRFGLSVLAPARALERRHSLPLRRGVRFRHLLAVAGVLQHALLGDDGRGHVASERRLGAVPGDAVCAHVELASDPAVDLAVAAA